MSVSHAERRASAQRHVDTGRKLIERQLQLIARVKARGQDPARSEDLLVSFEQTQAIFEADLAAILKGR